MFPIRDPRGRTIGFGGRLLGDGEPKYLNSPETVLFHKGRELYGLYEARQALRHIDRLVVVEGYMDVVALSEAGIDWSVATLGTATTADHSDIQWFIGHSFRISAFQFPSLAASPLLHLLVEGGVEGEFAAREVERAGVFATFGGAVEAF